MQPVDTPIHILLIEDDEVDIQNVLREFQPFRESFEFHIAKNGIEALDKLYGHHGTTKLMPMPKAIILDMNMPKMGGIEFLEKLRNDENFDSISIFIFTNEYSTRQNLADHHIRVTQRIVKPLQYDDVLRIVWFLTGKESP